MAERLRRRSAKPMAPPRVGSSPAGLVRPSMLLRIWIGVSAHGTLGHSGDQGIPRVSREFMGTPARVPGPSGEGRVS